jgi:hypothetical protein
MPINDVTRKFLDTAVFEGVSLAGTTARVDDIHSNPAHSAFAQMGDYADVGNPLKKRGKTRSFCCSHPP